MNSKIKYYLQKSRVCVVLLLVAVFSVALIQTHTIWRYDGEKVDENALCYFAVGFFGGDFDPHWYGYGSLGMYLLYGVYIVLALPLYVFGHISSLEDYGLRLFTGGYFIQVARYVFALLGVIVVLLYAVMVRRAKVPLGFVLGFVAVSIFSIDAIVFANYVRTDLLVAFFAAVVVFCAVESRRKIFLYLMAVAVAGAMSSKISALPLVLMLFWYCGLRFRDKTISLKDLFIVAVVFTACLHLFQPYVSVIDEILGNIILGPSWRQDIGSAYFFGKTYYVSVLDRLAAVAEIYIRYCGWPVILSLPLLFFAKPFLKIVRPAMMTWSLLMIPLVFSPEVLDYWLLPTFPIVRLLALFGIVGLLSHFPKVSGRMAIAVGIIFSVFVVKPGLENYISEITKPESNTHLAQKDIEKHFLENEFLLLESYRSHSIPKFYSREDIEMSKKISNVFIYGRWRNEYLNRIFEKYVFDHYYEEIGIQKVAGLQRIRFVDMADEEAVKALNDKYYVTMPSAYNTILKRSSKGLSPALRKRLEDLQSYYRYMISNPLVKRYDSGSGPVIEVYKITKIFEDNQSKNSF